MIYERLWVNLRIAAGSNEQTEKIGGLHSHVVPSQTGMAIEGKVEVNQLMYSGPLPQPADLEKYNAIVPGAAERILTMAEHQAVHRQELEKKVVYSGSRDSLLGLIFGFVIAIGTVGSGVYYVLNGHDVSGTIVSGTGLCGLVGVFVYGSRQRRIEREAKQKS
jgi:uncharacterized membrane protein